MNRNHYSPVFANKRWTDDYYENKFKRFYFCENRNRVVEAHRNIGKSGWGYEYDLYSEELEKRLGAELETFAEPIYEKLINHIILTTDERLKWGQFIVTQAVRTPSFFKYMDFIQNANGEDLEYKNSIIGCPHCPDSINVASKNWVILQAHEDEFFVRTDNPIYMNGFLDMPDTNIFYPLSPKQCFVACSMLEKYFVPEGEEPPYPKQEILQLEPGDAYAINFELIKSASREVILAIPNHNRAISVMNLEMLGAYPQIPYFITRAKNFIEVQEATDKLVGVMSMVDGIDYPDREYMFEYFFGVEFSMGLNPFSIFGVTDDRLPSLTEKTT